LILEKGTKIVVAVGIVMILLTVIMIGASITVQLQDTGADIGIIELTIDGKYANISVEMDIEPEVDEDDVDLDLVTDNSTIPLTYNDNKIKGTLNEREFTDVIDHHFVNITGEVEARVLGLVKISKDIRKEVNISFIHELSSSMNVENVDVEFSIFYTVMKFDIVANVTKDFQINITDTDAAIISPGGVYSAEVLELNYRTGETGNARVRIPLIGALGLALYNRNVIIEAWGISVTVDIPMFNG